MQKCLRLWRHLHGKVCFKPFIARCSLSMIVFSRYEMREGTMMLTCKKIKLEVSSRDAATLEFMQAKCRGLYNWQVMRLRNGETPGFPRVRPRHCFFTLCYPACYISIEGDRLVLPTGG